MMSSRHRATRAIGLATGLALAALFLLAFRVPAHGGTLGADVRMVAVPPGEVEVESDGDFLTARGLAPGGRAAHGTLRVRNVTGSDLRVRLRGLPSSRDLDRMVRVELRTDDRTFFRGSLRRLRHWTRAVPLRVRDTLTVSARVWIPEGATGDYEGREADVTVETRARSRR
jgi:hypothetical protein